MNSIRSFAVVLATCGFAWPLTNLAYDANAEDIVVASDQEPIELAGLKFKPAKRLQAGGKIIEVEPRGYACPGMGDVDGDGKEDLLVGQYKDGKIMLCKNLGQGEFAKPDWIMVDGEVAEVPGVW